MSVSQDGFTDALLTPDRPVPEGLVNPDGAPAAKRFDVYRNNVVLSLTDALGVSFPVIAKLLGTERFPAMAGIFVRAHPPQDPRLMLYGDALPGFLERFEPVAELGYLPDVARLELALRRSYHAADAAPIDPARLQTTPPEALMAARVGLAPALRLIRSPWPILGIWRFNTEEGAPKPVMAAEDVLITRPDFDPEPQLLPPGAADFIAGLAAGTPFGQALEAATATTPDFDLSATLGLLLAGGAMTSLD